jgi:hypothetical protein
VSAPAIPSAEPAIGCNSSRGQPAASIPLTGGSIAVNGREVTEPRQHVALMFQRPTLLPWQNALLPRKLGGR